MLRPATPLSIIFLVAFVLLLLSTLSTPIIKSIPLGRYQKYNFGVLGYCHDDGTCLGPQLGYSTDGLFTSDGTSGTDGDFTLPSSTRHSLSSILIIHPIAALLALVCFGLACAAHLRGPSHSPRYLLALLILTIPTLLCTILAFLVDILLWVPHMQWGGWIVLGATILIIASSIVTCAMRRTLVSRKARKKRIAENADMNGATYYDALAQQRMMNDEVLPKAESPPPMSGSTAVEKAEAQQYATYEMKREAGTPHGDDDRTPLNPTASIRSASAHGDVGGRRPYGDDGAPPMPTGAPVRRDQYGNVIAAAGIAGASGAALTHQHSQGSLNSNSNQSNGYARGRGGYGPPPRGYGMPRGRGYGARGPPPPGWNGGRGRGRGYGPPPGMMRGRGNGPRPGPPPGYGPPRQQYSPHQYDSQPPRDHDQFVAGPFIGQAIEMDERTGAPQQAQPSYANNSYGLRDSDDDVMGMVGLQGGMPNASSNGVPQNDMRSPTSTYSDERYVPPRRQWEDQHSPLPQHQGLSMPDESHHSYATNGHSSAAPSSNALPMSPMGASASTRSATTTNPHHSDEVYMPTDPMPVRNRANSQNYYEDVDPRFAVAEENKHQSALPSALTPGAAGARSPPPGTNYL